MKLIKIAHDHYVIVDDSKIKMDDWYYHSIWQELFCLYKDTMHNKAFELEKAYKITHSTQPLETLKNEYAWYGGDNKVKQKDFSKIISICLQEVKELIGEVDVEKKANVRYDRKNSEYDEDKNLLCGGFIDGYNQALEDNKEYKFSESEMWQIFNKGIFIGISANRKDAKETFENFISSLTQPKTEWEVEFIDGKLKLK